MDQIAEPVHQRLSAQKIRQGMPGPPVLEKHILTFAWCTSTFYPGAIYTVEPNKDKFL